SRARPRLLRAHRGVFERQRQPGESLPRPEPGRGIDHSARQCFARQAASREAYFELTKMGVTKSWERTAEVKLGLYEDPVPAGRKRETIWLIGASLLIAAGLAHVLLAKTQDFGEQQSRLDRGELLDLNAVRDPRSLDPFLLGFNDRERISE